MNTYALKLTILNSEESLKSVEPMEFVWKVGQANFFKVPSDMIDSYNARKASIKQKAARDMVELLKETLDTMQKRE